MAGRELRYARCCSCAWKICQYLNIYPVMCVTYKRKSAVAAGGNFRLVGVDEDLRMAQRTAAAVAADDSALGPADGLSMDEFDGSHGLRLYIYQHCSLFPFVTVSPNLIFHNSLLETRARHGLLPGGLACGPGVGAVRGLEVTVTLA